MCAPSSISPVLTRACSGPSVSIATAFPVFFNGIALFLLRDKVWALLKDYKARYLGLGEVDPNFHPFAEEDPVVMEKIQKNLR